jgi:hypothetical protein
MKERPAADLVPQGDLTVVFFGALVGIVEVAAVFLAVYGLVRAIGWVIAQSRAAWCNPPATIR